MISQGFLKESDRFRVGDWRVDPRVDAIERDGTTVKLVPKTMQVLSYLAGRAGEVVAQEELEKAVWTGVIVTPSSVYQAIADLRRALGDDKHEPRYIVTVPRKGYRLIAAVAADRVAGETRAGENATERRSGADRRARSRRHPFAAAAGVAVVLALAGALSLFAFESWLAPEAHADPRSIAVLPVADFSATGDPDHFADGLTEEMLNTLAQIPGLKVTARTSAYVFKDRHEDVRAIGRMLGTRYVLEGSVRRDAERMRVTAQLIDARDGYHLWSKTFERSASGALAIQEDIARAVADSLKVTLTEESMERVAARRTDSGQAFERYLLGRHHQMQRNAESVDKAIRYQREALQLDPGFALAYAGLADAHMASYYYNNRPLAELAPIIEPLLARGLAINPKLPELHAARAVLRIEQLDFEAARRDLREAIDLNPSFAEAYVRLGAAHEYEGEPRQALAALSKATELDPLHFILHVRRCLALQNLGQYFDAEAACERAIELQPAAANGYLTRGLLALARGRHDRAIADYLTALERTPARVDLLGQLGWLYLDVGAPDLARRTFDRAVEASGPGPGFATLTRTRWYVATNDMQGLRSSLDALPTAESDANGLIDIALMQLIAGRPRLAQQRVREARARTGFSASALLNPWYTRWGHSDVLTLALVARSAGDEATAQRHLDTLDAHLARFERNGHVWHGLHYLRADVLAMRGRPQDALRELERAAALGWRRTWWAKKDPALANVVGLPGFTRLSAAIDRSGGPLRARIAATSDGGVAVAAR